MGPEGPGPHLWGASFCFFFFTRKRKGALYTRTYYYIYYYICPQSRQIHYIIHYFTTNSRIFARIQANLRTFTYIYLQITYKSAQFCTQLQDSALDYYFSHTKLKFSTLLTQILKFSYDITQFHANHALITEIVLLMM